MATSRTGTTTYLRNRARVLRAARAEGLTHCPGYTDDRGVHHPCGVELDFETPGLPNSAETDHIVEVRHGGSDEVENLRVLCRRQNLERNRSKPPVPTALAEQFPTVFAW